MCQKGILLKNAYISFLKTIINIDFRKTFETKAEMKEHVRKTHFRKQVVLSSIKSFKMHFCPFFYLIVWQPWLCHKSYFSSNVGGEGWTFDIVIYSKTQENSNSTAKFIFANIRFDLFFSSKDLPLYLHLTRDWIFLSSYIFQIISANVRIVFGEKYVGLK